MLKELKSIEEEVKKEKSISWKEVLELIKKMFSEYFSEDPFRHAASLAYFALFSLVPIVYLGIYLFGQILGNETVHLMIYEFMHSNLGIDDMTMISDFLKTYDLETRKPFMEIIGVVILLFSSSAFVMTLRNSINDYFDVKTIIAPVKYIIFRKIITRLIAIASIGTFGVIVILIYLSQTLLISLTKEMIHNVTFQFLIRNGLAHFGSIATNFLIFTYMFKYVHDGKVRWKPAMYGALLTALLVYLAQVLVKFYLTNFSVIAQGGVAGSVFVILTWIFATGLIIFFGAKFVKIYSAKIGHPIKSRYKLITKDGRKIKVEK